MNTTLRLKLFFLFCLTALAAVIITPSINPSVPSWWRQYLSPGSLHLGLDLQGGMHLVLKVNLKQAEINSLELAANDIKESLHEKSLSAVRTPSNDPNVVLLTLPNVGAVDQINSIVKENFPDIDARIETKEGSFPRVFLSLKDKAKTYIKTHAVDQSLEILRNRIDQFGVAEPVIIRQGDDEIVIQLPGVKDPDRAMKLIGDTAQLEFKMVADSHGVDLNGLIDQAKKSGQWHDKEDVSKLNRAVQSSLPEGTSIYFEKEKNKQTHKESFRPVLLENKSLMTGDMVKDAQVRIGGTFNQPYVGLDLTGRGGKVFATITEKNVGRQMAIVLDNVVRSAPVIRERILGGSAQISGDFTHEEASDLAIVLRVGALPAPVDIIQNMSVGASLGQDSIHKGLVSGFLGTVLVVGFMLIYYRLSGTIANVALVLNILFTFAGLAVLNATLTLPGIAGIVLSIGMAVDSNVLIFERMRDESSLGKTIRSSIESGFGKAFWTVMDAQLTTLISAIALFWFGTGPIKGFAITLSLGILFNLFTALTCSQMMFDVINSFKPIQRIKYLHIIGKTSIDFLKIKYITFFISGATALIGVIAVIQIARGHANMGVDFTGGSLLQYKAEQSFSMDEVRKAFTHGKLGDVVLQQVENESRLIVKVKKSEEVLSGIKETVSGILAKELPEKKFVLESQSDIGASISSTLRNKAFLAIVISLGGIVVYLAFRFDLRYGVGALVATLHDIFCVIGICWLFNMEFTLLIVTALLTLAGYSVNDTVIVFDRIRENTQKEPESSMTDIINHSVNQVLARTIVTSINTSLAVLALYLFGGSVIHDFSFTLLIGIIIGTYSSVFVASPILTLWPERKA